MDKPGLLLVTHHFGGGVEKHVFDLIELLRDVARVELLRPDLQGNLWLSDAQGDASCLGRDNWPAVLELLRARHYQRVHFHHVQGFPPQVLDLASALGLSYDLTLHDYFPYCPQYALINENSEYCGEPELAGCEQCVLARPHAWGLTVAAWRAAMRPFIDSAQRVFVPSRFVEERLLRHFPAARVLVRVHPARADWRLFGPQPTKVLVLGTLSRRKGFDIFVACAQDARARRLPLSYCLLGYAEHLLPADLPVQIRGEYADEQLPELVALERADVIWIPTRVPETYSYVLDVALASGRPIVATRIGAIEERLRERPGATLLPIDADAADWNAALLQAGSSAVQPALDLSSIGASRMAYRDELLAPLLRSAEGQTMAELAEIAEIPSVEVTSAATVAPSLAKLFEDGVLGGHAESRRALRKRLLDVERDYTVLHEYETLHGARWFEQLQEVNDARDKQRELNEAVTNLKLHLAKLDAEIEERGKVVGAQHLQIGEQRAHIERLDLELAEKIRHVELLGEHVELLGGQLEEQLRQIHLLDLQVEEKVRHIDALQGEAAQKQVLLDQTNLRAEELARESADRSHWIDELRRELGEVRGQVDAAVLQIRSYENSTSWKITRPLRGAKRVAANASHALARKARVLRRGLSRLPVAYRIWRSDGTRALAQRVRQKLFPPKLALPALTAEEAAAIGPLVLDTCPDSRVPRTSIVIPVYGQHVYTFNCLRSLGIHTALQDVEIIVVDDASPTPATVALKDVQGIRFVRNKANRGFIGSCNAGAQLARGEYLVLLNNDVQVTAGWLDALLNVFKLRANAGMVGARLVYPDGRLQEAGGIVWRDGSAWNWGRGQDPENPVYRYLRAADYCSGACLALRRADWEALGGFDKRYAPAYYEDTDLAFRIRQAGKKVFYQPESVIVHFEGVSSGTDETAGVKRHQVINRETFFQRWQKELSTHRPNALSPELEVDRAAKARVLIVEACMITPDQDSGSVRMQAILELLVEGGCKVSFVADNLEHRQPYVQSLQQAGVEVWHGPYIRSVEELLTQRGAQFDAIILCRHYIAAPYMDRVRKWAPNARIVFDTVDLHFLREQRLAELEDSPSLAATAQKTREQELGVIGKADITLVVSPVEQSLLAELSPQSDVRILSNIHEPQPCDVGYAQRHGLLFVGGFQHPPNIDAVRWFVTEIWPLVRQELPDIEVTIVGSKMPDSMRALAGPGIDIKGFVQDIEPLLRSTRISIAPLRYGAGVKGKMNQAMAWGIPVVATTVASEGMGLQNGRELLVADTPAEFARAVVRLYNDERLWTQLSDAGRENISRHFSRATARAVLEGLLESPRR